MESKKREEKLQICENISPAIWMWRVRHRGCDKTANCAVSGNYTPQSAVYCWDINCLLAYFTNCKAEEGSAVVKLRLYDYSGGGGETCSVIKIFSVRKINSGDEVSCSQRRYYMWPCFQLKIKRGQWQRSCGMPSDNDRTNIDDLERSRRRKVGIQQTTSWEKR